MDADDFDRKFDDSGKVMNQTPKFYSEDPGWYGLVGNIHALLERVKISEDQSSDVLRLRKLNRILSIHGSTAIEGNRLSVNQVTDVVNGRLVWGPPKDIKEVQNAWEAYGQMASFDPWSVTGRCKNPTLMAKTAVPSLISC